MRTRKISVLTMTAVALGLALTACDNDGGDNASSSASSSSVTTSNTAESGTVEGKSSDTPAKSDAKCTDQINYAEDSRSNAEINSIGEDTGTCPPVKK
ncbi:hypothetical protein QBA37_11720 [Streptomyces silvae]|uniref:Secreted protein n=1 Tax=Streptomyces silvae TaxID=2803812 RepID=A0ABU8A0J8_9ACTN